MNKRPTPPIHNQYEGIQNIIFSSYQITMLGGDLIC